MNNRQDDSRRDFGNFGDETQHLSSQPDQPRQYFPPQNQPGAQNQPGYQDQDFGQQQYRPYDQPQFSPQPGGVYSGAEYEEAPRRGGGATGWILGVLLVLALAGVIVLFFLWQNAASQPEPEPAPPVTETSTVEQTTTVTEPAPEEPTTPADSPPPGIPEVNPEELLPEGVNPEDINPEDILPEGLDMNDLQDLFN